MTEQADMVETHQVAGQPLPSPVKPRRWSMPLMLASVIMFLALVSFVLNGTFLLVDLGLFKSGVGVVPVVLGALTPEGQQLVLGAAYLFFGLVALVVLVAFLLRRRWAWSAAMTWAALSLLVGVIAYLLGHPDYYSMLTSVILVLALNQAELHRVFRVGGRS